MRAFLGVRNTNPHAGSSCKILTIHILNFFHSLLLYMYIDTISIVNYLLLK